MPDPVDDDNVLDGFVLDEAEVIYWACAPIARLQVLRSLP